MSLSCLNVWQSLNFKITNHFQNFPFSLGCSIISPGECRILRNMIFRQLPKTNIGITREGIVFTKALFGIYTYTQDFFDECI